MRAVPTVMSGPSLQRERKAVSHNVGSMSACDQGFTTKRAQCTLHVDVCTSLNLAVIIK